MTEASIPVDLLNPGQVFACLGLVEAAETLLGGAAGGFDWSEPDAARFRLRADGDESPVAAVLAFLAEANVTTLAPAGSQNDTAKWSVETRVRNDGTPFPSPDPPSPATLPAVLEQGDHRIVIDHWADATRRRDNVKFWAGSGGYPGAGLLRDAIELVRTDVPEAADDPFALGALQSSSFRFDWRRDYVPLDTGFSLNAHATIRTLGYPLVEVLAAIGLTHARPLRSNKLAYRYGVIGRADPAAPEEHAFLPPEVLRPALGCAPLPFPTRTFRMELGWPGQEGQARCITTVSEELES